MRNIVWIICLLLVSCQNRNEPDFSSVSKATKTNDLQHLVADTIIYDVIIKNTNPYDEWVEKSLEKLQRVELVDSIFNMIYKEEVSAYEYFTNEPLNQKDIRNIETEEGFSRRDIGKIQFTERWYFDKKSRNMNKEVLSIVLGHELYTDSGEFRGYKPLFKVLLTP